MLARNTYRVVESSPFSVDDHVLAVLACNVISELGDVLDLLDVGTVRSSSKDGTYGAY